MLRYMFINFYSHLIFYFLFLFFNILGAFKHEEAMREMAKRKSNLSLQNANNNNLINKNSRTLGQINSTSLKGASSGQKTRNKYLQDFEKLKAGYSNKKGKKK